MIKRTGTQELQLSFVTHEVTVLGSHLRKIETALQRRELAHLAVTIPGAEKIGTEGQPIVRKITVIRVEQGSAEART